MRLTDTINKIKGSVHYLPDIPKDLFIIILILLTAIGSFMIGKLSFFEEKSKKELQIISMGAVVAGAVKYSSQDKQNGAIPDVGVKSDKPSLPSSGEIFSQSKASGMYVGARSGSTYYLPWCGGAKRIHEENKIWFENKADAVNKGYKPSGACKGI
jgi:hypothetical protein